jgi:hypothetical protein
MQIGAGITQDGMLHVKSGENTLLNLESTQSFASTGVGAIKITGANGPSALIGFNGTANEFDVVNYLPGPMRFFTNNTQQMTIAADGKVGIGTTSPGSLLDVNGGQIRVRGTGVYSEPNAGCGVLYYDANGGTFTMDARSPSGSTAISFRTSSGGTGAERMKVLNSGAVGINQLAGSGNRAVYSDANGNLTNTSSDATLKENVATVTDGASIVAALRPVRFNWKDADRFGAQREIGFLAQEVQTVLPEVVGTNNDGTLTVDYPHMVAALVSAVQDLQRQIATMKADPTTP